MEMEIITKNIPQFPVPREEPVDWQRLVREAEAEALASSYKQERSTQP